MWCRFEGGDACARRRARRRRHLERRLSAARDGDLCGGDETGDAYARRHARRQRTSSGGPRSPCCDGCITVHHITVQYIELRCMTWYSVPLRSVTFHYVPSHHTSSGRPRGHVGTCGAPIIGYGLNVPMTSPPPPAAGGGGATSRAETRARGEDPATSRSARGGATLAPSAQRVTPVDHSARGAASHSTGV